MIAAATFREGAESAKEGHGSDPGTVYTIKRMSFALIKMLETSKLYQKRSCNAVFLNLEKYLEHVEASLKQ